LVWGKEILFFASAEDEQRPSLQLDPDGTLWVLAGKRLAGIRNGQRVELASPLSEPADQFLIDSAGRFWFFRSLVRTFDESIDYITRPGGRVSIMLLGGKSLYEQTFEIGLGYRPPFLDSKGDLWSTADSVIYRIHQGLPPVGKGTLDLRIVGPLDEARHAPLPQPVHVPHETIQINGKVYTLFFAEMHTHLGETPTSQIIETWPDRFYLKAARSGVLDAGSLSDHDWFRMTNSKYLIEQAYSSVLSIPNHFQAFAGYEWSGDFFTRRRYGDRTVTFLEDYSPIFRITDPESNTLQKLHTKLKPLAAIDWPHHLGAPFAVMDWTTHDGTVEPVVEMVSSHGVYETYHPEVAVPVKYTQALPIGKSSVQDGLAAGKRFGLVGSSDSHSGLSGYSNGMLGIYAESLTRASLIQAFHARRTFAIRGGEPLLLDVRVNGAFMGQEIGATSAPRLSVRVQAKSPIQKIEIVRDGRYIYARPGEGKQSSFEYQDMEKGKYYYVRVWLEGGKYAWSSPVWID
jgi:hypothetical protein